MQNAEKQEWGRNFNKMHCLGDRKHFGHTAPCCFALRGALKITSLLSYQSEAALPAWLLSSWNLGSVTEELNFYFFISISLNVNSHIWQVTAILNKIGLRFKILPRAKAWEFQVSLNEFHQSVYSALESRVLSCLWAASCFLPARFFQWWMNVRCLYVYFLNKILQSFSVLLNLLYIICWQNH